MTPIHIIMPVKDSPDTTREAIDAVLQTPDADFTVYNDFSTPENTAILQQLAQEHGFQLVNWADRTDHPSPNYRLTLQDAQQRALAAGAHLVIVESDVMLKPDTIRRLNSMVADGVGMVAAVTVDNNGNINFPYQYARRMQGDVVSTRKRFSFCCTLLTNQLLQGADFHQLDPTKAWYDVTISHQSIKLGLRNLLMLNNPVEHRPHSSRPWKQLKYTHPLRYYWQKITRKRDRI
ncbi:MAG: glycosyltransferase [Bacteroidales bacterium]|nr:glycosyltransferase [Bacteroidales bacterium]